MEKCRTLHEYSVYVDRVRTYAKTYPIEEAVERAITECIEKNILKDFLLSQRAEAKAMSIFEYNEEEELKKYRAAERENGIDIGIGMGRIESILMLLEEKGVIPAELRMRMESEQNPEVLKKWLLYASKAATVEEFWRLMDEV